jgi:hypothetical protein
MANPDIPERWYQPDTNAEHVVTSEPGVRVLRALRSKSRDCGTTVHRRPQFVRTWLTVVVVIIAAMTGVSISVSVPTVRADDQQYEAFYTPPDPLPAGMPGDVIRAEPSRLVLEPSGQLGSFVGTGTRIMYRSTDAQGKPAGVTGTYIEPDVPWPGNGPRPLLAYATAPYGMGEQCAPSKLFNQGIHASLDTGFDLMFNIEEGFIATLLARGFAIVITDGVGLGVHGPMAPQFLNRLAGVTAVLDAARAAMRLPGTSLNPHRRMVQRTPGPDDSAVASADLGPAAHGRRGAARGQQGLPRRHFLGEPDEARVSVAARSPLEPVLGGLQRREHRRVLAHRFLVQRRDHVDRRAGRHDDHPAADEHRERRGGPGLVAGVAQVPRRHVRAQRGWHRMDPILPGTH